MSKKLRKAGRGQPTNNDTVKESKSKLLNSTIQSYDFDNRNFLYLYSQFPELQRAIDSGKYVYVNGKVVLKSKDCLRIENGRLTTIVFSDDELSEYCLSRILTITRTRIGRFHNDISGEHYYRPSTLKREICYKEAKKISSLKDITNDNLFLMIGGGQDPPNDFCRALVHFMSSRNVTIEQLADETGLSEKTIQRMRNDSDRTPEIESVVAVCVGLHLDPYDSDMLLRLAGYILRNSRIHRIYRLFLHFAYKEGVKDCNDMLIRLGEKPLTGLHE